MDSEVVIAFNKALLSMTEAKPPISKQKIFEITKAAMNAIRYFKHVVLAIEKFLVKCRSEYKISGLYVMDSILRQANKQYQHKDVFAPRFAINLMNTFTNVLSCDGTDRIKAVRVINLWLANGIFKEDVCDLALKFLFKVSPFKVIEPLLQHCRASGLEVDMRKVELSVKGEKANMQIYGSEVAEKSAHRHPRGQEDSARTPPSTLPRTPPLELRPETPSFMDDSSYDQRTENCLTEKELLSVLEDQLESQQLAALASGNHQLMRSFQKLINERITEKLEIEGRRQGNIKNLLSREFGDDYSDDEEEDDRARNESATQVFPKEHILSIARSLLSDSVIAQELHQIHQQDVGQHQDRLPSSHQQHLQSNQQPFSMPNFAVPPPNGRTPFIPIGVPPPMGQMLSNYSPNRPPPQMASAFANQAALQSQNGSEHRTRGENRSRGDHDRNRKRERSRSREPDRDMRARREADESRSRNDRSRSDRRTSSNAPSSDRRRRTRSPVQSDHSRSGSDRRSERENREREQERAVKDVEKEKERERRKNGFPTHPKDDHVLIASRTLWFGRIPSNCSESDIRDSVKDAGQPEKVNIVVPRGCAYVTMRERRAAFKIIDRLARDLQVLKKTVKISWATIQGIKDNEKLMDYWDSGRGIAQIPFSKLPDRLDALLEGAYMDIHTLPSHLKGLYDARGPKVQEQVQGQIPLPSGAQPSSGMFASSPTAAQFSQVPAPALQMPGNMFQSFQQQLNLSNAAKQFGGAMPMQNVNAGDQQQALLPSAMLAAFGFPPGIIPPPPAGTAQAPGGYQPTFMNAPGALLPNSNAFAAGSQMGLNAGKPMIPPPTMNTPNFQQQQQNPVFRPQQPFGGANGNRQPFDYQSDAGRGARAPFRGFGFRIGRGGAASDGGGRGSFNRFESPRGGRGRGSWSNNAGGGAGGQNFAGPSTGEDGFGSGSPGGFRGDSGNGFRGNRGTGRFGFTPNRGGFRGRFNSTGNGAPFNSPQGSFGNGGGGFRNNFNNNSDFKAPLLGAPPPGLLPTPPPHQQQQFTPMRQFTRFSAFNEDQGGEELHQHQQQAQPEEGSQVEEDSHLFEDPPPGMSPGQQQQHSFEERPSRPSFKPSFSNLTEITPSDDTNTSLPHIHSFNLPKSSHPTMSSGEEFVSTTNQEGEPPRPNPIHLLQDPDDISRAEVSSTTFHDEVSHLPPPSSQQPLLSTNEMSQQQTQPQDNHQQTFSPTTESIPSAEPVLTANTTSEEQ